MRISDWSSDVCSSDLARPDLAPPVYGAALDERGRTSVARGRLPRQDNHRPCRPDEGQSGAHAPAGAGNAGDASRAARSEEHTSELQSLMRISYAVFCLKKKNNNTYTTQLALGTYYRHN